MLDFLYIIIFQAYQP